MTFANISLYSWNLSLFSSFLTSSKLSICRYVCIYLYVTWFLWSLLFCCAFQTSLHSCAAQYMYNLCFLYIFLVTRAIFFLLQFVVIYVVNVFYICVVICVVYDSISLQSYVRCMFSVLHWNHMWSCFFPLIWSHICCLYFFILLQTYVWSMFSILLCSHVCGIFF